MRKYRILAATMLACLAPLAARAEAPDPAGPAAPARQQQQRPNVLLWMLDDVGFAQLSCFGGLVPTPNIDRVARLGLRYSNYHTPPICSASRAAILTGRMPHNVHIGGHAAAARPFPGYDAHIPASAGTIAANLHQAGYATFALGKWDHLPTEEITPAGPFNHWATGQGFDRFYGFLSADTDNWHPTLIRNLEPVAAPARPDYHLSADLADQAIGMIGSRDAGSEKRPFFLYWATGAAHAPHHAPADWIARFAGKFDMGWDKARETILRREIAAGLVPRGTRLAPRPEAMPAWDSLSADQKRMYARQMETFAAALSHADAQFGRILDALEARGELDNTMVVVTSDNGASAEGGPEGLYNEMLMVFGQPSLAANMRFYRDWGGPRTYPHYSMGWAVAGNTPFRNYKQTTHEGGTRVPLVVAWPRGIAARGEVRGQFVHVSDIAPTILEAAHVPLAATVNDVPQSPMDGLSFTSSFSDPKVPSRRQAQYFEMYGNRALWAQGWTVVTSHRTKTWSMVSPKTFDEPWELYDTVKDPGQTTDLAARHPAKVAELSKLFDEQAERHHVNPLGNIGDTAIYSMGKAAEDFARRGGKWRYAGPVASVTGQMAPPITSRSFTMSAKLDLPDASITGPVFAQGGRLGGIGLYLRSGKPVMIVNTIEGVQTEVASSEAMPVGVSTLAVDFAASPGAVPPSAPMTPIDYRVTIRSGTRVLAQGAMHTTLAATFGIAETFGVGVDTGSTVLTGVPDGISFAGGLSDVIFDFNSSN